MLTDQELFDSQACFNPDQALMLLRFSELWKANEVSFVNNGPYNDYYRGINAIAEEFGLEYTPPKRVGSLAPVSPTIH